MRIAVVGAGVSGLVAAHYLVRRHDVVVFEAQDRLGGHAHTHELDVAGRRRRLDTGFLVFNAEAYPGFVRLLDELGVATQPSDMSLSIRCRACRLEYALRGPAALLARPVNLFRPSFWGMFRDLFRFFRDARAWLATPAPDVTVRAFVVRGGYGDRFVRHWLLPTAAAVWSAPFRDVLDYSARMLLGFFRNHGFLERRQRPWLAVAGGARTYVDAIAARLGSRVRLAAPVREVARHDAGVLVRAAGGGPERFDAVVLACHADEALALLAAAAPEERALLARFPYARHRVVLHTDASFLPRARRAWSSWNCDQIDCHDDRGPVSLTYHLNRLMSLDDDVPFCVTLNPGREPTGILRELAYAHPTLTADAMDAQAALLARNGQRGTWFAGAHLRFGFHEDGVASGIRVATALGCPP
jgi:predicted NAD/FAD-binding protein